MTLGTPVQLGAEELIELSEKATVMSPGWWSVALIRAGFPQARTEDVLALPVGARDQAILALRRRHRGDQFWSEPVCAHCGEVFQLKFTAGEIGLDALPEPAPGYREVDIEGGRARLRPISVEDLLAIESVADVEAAARALGARVSEDDSGVTVEALGDALEALDPMADIWLEATCPECGAGQSIAFDPVYFVAGEIRQMAGRILRDVVNLARAFHWSERDILAMPEARRAYYVAEASA